MRKRLGSKIVSMTPNIGTIRRVKKEREDKAIPGFTAEMPVNPDDTPQELSSLEPARRFSLKMFVMGASGGFSKRAFFFSLFAFTAFIYLALCMTGLVMFDDKLGLFILGCNAAFGLNYYKNEQDKGGIINGQ